METVLSIETRYSQGEKWSGIALNLAWNRPWIRDDILQDFWAQWYDENLLPEGTPINHAIWKIKCNLIDRLRSRTYNWSTDGQFEHRHLGDLEYIGARTREDSAADFSLIPLLDEFESVLDDERWDVVWKLFVEGCTQIEVAQALGYSHAWIWELKDTALKKLRRYLNE